jgi:2-polyprenyl-3-methyl-5-hydroxy-6-metoxy-1,4-benzoquinol methylase
MGIDDEQRRHFDDPRHQYPREAIIDPPLHTRLELLGVIDALAGVPRGQPVLDFGAGTGRLSIPLARAGHAVLAVDISERSLAALRDLAEKLGISGIGTSTSMPAGETFAAVAGADVLHHVGLDDALPRLHALLADGGRLVFTEPGGMNPAWWMWFAIIGRLAVERRIATCNLRTLRRALARHGFRDVRITGVGLLPRPLFRWSATACRLNDRAGNLPILRWLAYRYLIVATR